MFILVEPSLELNSESLQGSYPGPANKYFIQHQTCAFVSVHHRRPSAREATPPHGVAQSPRQYPYRPGTDSGRCQTRSKMHISQDRMILQKMVV